MLDPKRYSLRFRIFLFFCLQTLVGVAIAGFALYVGAARGTGNGGYLTAGILLAFGLSAQGALFWLLFDEALARPVEKLAANLRASAHAGVSRPLEPNEARHLGDLAPAASALSAALSDAALSGAAQVSAATARLSEEKTRLTELLTEIPVAIMLVNARDEIVLYDGQAAEVLAQIAPPRLNAALTDYFEPESLMSARRKLNKTGKDVRFEARGLKGQQRFDARMKPLDDGGYLLLIEGEDALIAPEATRPLVFDFALLDRRPTQNVEATALEALSYTVFDTETTGLLPHKDEIVQIGAVRVVNGRIVPGERFDQLVDPDRPIPPKSSAVHGITDAMVAGQPDIVQAAQGFHGYARGSVIVAHNAPFDMAFLRRHANRCGLVWDHPILDTVLLSAVLFGTAQKHTLDALCDRLGVDISERARHTAIGDAQATAEVFVRMLAMLQAKGLTDLGAVLEETRRHGRLLEDLN